MKSKIHEYQLKKINFMSKKIFLLLLITLVSTIGYSQKKEKIKGSKIVTTEIKKMESFDSVEIADNLEVFLIKGTENSIEIEADDNLHEVINFAYSGSLLRITTSKDVTSSKKFSVKITYTETLKNIIARNDVNVTALSDLELADITFKGYDYAKFFINSKSKSFTLLLDDKSKAEINSKGEKSTISLSKSSSLKALIVATDLIFDMYQKSDAEVEGDAENMKLRLDNNASFVGKNMIAQNLDLTTESYTTASIQAKTKAVIDAAGKSEIELYGDQKIEIKRFADSAILKKKPTK